MKAIRVVLEGGAAGAARIELRKAMAAFLRKGLSSDVDITVITGGPRAETFKLYCRERRLSPGGLVVLLVDSETPVRTAGECWQHLAANPQDRWPRPTGASDSECHLMVQAMEAWFLADPDALAQFYGKRRRHRDLAVEANVEALSPQQQINALNVIVGASKKGKYKKASHAPAILARLDPAAVRARAQHCDRLFQALETMIRE